MCTQRMASSCLFVHKNQICWKLRDYPCKYTHQIECDEVERNRCTSFGRRTTHRYVNVHRVSSIFSHQGVYKCKYSRKNTHTNHFYDSFFSDYLLIIYADGLKILQITIERSKEKTWLKLKKKEKEMNKRKNFAFTGQTSSDNSRRHRSSNEYVRNYSAHFLLTHWSRGLALVVLTELFFCIVNARAHAHCFHRRHFGSVSVSILSKSLAVSRLLRFWPTIYVVFMPLFFYSV